jgi:hypothetical protein
MLVHSQTELVMRHLLPHMRPHKAKGHKRHVPPPSGLRIGSVVLILIGRMIEMMTIIVDFLTMIVIITHVSATLQNRQKLEIVSPHTIKKYVD